MVEEGDILDPGFPESFAKKILKKFKKIDVLIHNVGGGGRWGKDSIFDTDPNVWNEVYEKNNRGVVLFSKFFYLLWLKINGGE